MKYTIALLFAFISLQTYGQVGIKKGTAPEPYAKFKYRTEGCWGQPTPAQIKENEKVLKRFQDSINKTDVIPGASLTEVYAVEWGSGKTVRLNDINPDELIFNGKLYRIVGDSDSVRAENTVLKQMLITSYEQIASLKYQIQLLEKYQFDKIEDLEKRYKK